MANKPLFKFLPLVFLLHSAVFAHGIFPTSEPKESNLFIHPVTLASNILNIYLTAQFPLGEAGGNYHIVVQPSFLRSSLFDSDYFRYGSGIGIRRFIGEVFYIQIMPSMFYLNGFTSDNEAISGPMINALGYLGVHPGDFYFDVGVGYGWAFLPKTAKNYSFYPYHIKNNRGLTFDINFGISPVFCLALIILLPLIFI